MLTIPNVLTFSRLALLIPMIALFFMDYASAAWLCFFLYTIGALTDGLDGWVARKYNQISKFGIFLDPISDKIYVVTIMLMLIATDRINGIFVILPIIILTREFTVSGLREYLGANTDIDLPVTNLAKWKTATQMVSIGILILAPHVPLAQGLGSILLIAATVLTCITGWHYLKASWPYLKD